MRFDYSITAADYVAAQKLYYKLALGRKRVEIGITWTLVSVFTGVVAATHSPFDWGTVLLGMVSAWCMYAGLSTVFPTAYIRRQYRKAFLDGKTFHADLDQQGFQVSEDDCTWRIPWSGVSVKGENAQVFILYSDAAHTIFIFGKTYITSEQQAELRTLASLSPGHIQTGASPSVA